MASLNTLRTRYGIVLSVVIALVLVAFILGDQLSMQGRTSNMPEDKTVITVNGKDIKASEYAKYQELYRETNLSADAKADLTYEFALFNAFSKDALEALGLGVSEADIKNYAKIVGKQWTDQYLMYGYPADIIKSEVERRWVSGLPTIDMSLGYTKFTEAYVAANYVNRLEVEKQMRDANLTFDGRYVMVPYSAMPAVEVSEEEINAYYEANKQPNKRFGERTLRYVAFEIEPTAEDKAEVEKMVKDVDAMVVAANGDSETIKRAVRSIGGKSDRYKLFSALEADVAEAVKGGKNYGPVLVDDEWKTSYVVSDVKAPESFEFEVVTADNVVAAKALAEELVAAGGDFTKLETAVDVANDSRKMVNMNESDANNFIGRKVGDIFTYTYNNKPAVVKITKLGDVDRFVLTADIAKRIEASELTRNNIVKSVDTFLKDAGNSVETFDAAATAAHYQILVTTANRNDYTPMMNRERGVRNIPASRSIAVWAYDALVGEVKSFHGENVIYVAIVSAINDNKYEMINTRAIENTLKHDKQYEAIASQLAIGAEIEGATEGKFSGVKFADYSVDGKYDQALVGAIASSRETGVETKVKGTNGAYVFVVDAINGDVDLTTVDTERTPSMTQRESQMGQAAVDALTSKAKVKDLRGEGEI